MSADLTNFKSLCAQAETLRRLNAVSTEHVASVRRLTREIDALMSQTLCADDDDDEGGASGVTSADVARLQAQVDALEQGSALLDNGDDDVETTASIEMFQLGASIDDVTLEFAENSTVPPEKGTIVQKLWRVAFADGTQGHAIFADVSDRDVAALFNAQVSTALATAPSGAVEDLDITVSLAEVREHLATSGQGGGLRDVSDWFVGLQKPGLTARQVRDVDVDTDPELASLPADKRAALASASVALNSAASDDAVLQATAQMEVAASDAGLYSTALGPFGNVDYSDLKRLRVQKDDGSTATVTVNLPVVCWSTEPIAGIPLRDTQGPTRKSNRKDDGTSYIVDLGGFDPVIRRGRPNPLPPTRFYNNGPAGATADEGALQRYGGGKCLGFNTSADAPATLTTLHHAERGEIELTLAPMTAVWKIDRATFDGGNRHAYYTVFSASRPPPAGFMGVVFAPKQNRLGRGIGEIASGVTLANGVSQTGKTFNVQDANGALLDINDNEVPSGLKGLTSAFDGHAMLPADLLAFLEDNAFVKGIDYLTIPADATRQSVEDVLIPAGKFVPQISQALAPLRQFANGKYIQNGGPGRFQSGLIPFLPGTLAYTPEWQIHFVHYNCGSVECEGTAYPITNVAADSEPASWIRPGHNASFGAPGPSPANSRESGYSPAHPDTFDPVQLRCGIKSAHCVDFIERNVAGATDAEITLSQLPQLEAENKIFITEAPGGAMRGWVKFLVVNCPLPCVATIDVVKKQPASGSGSGSNNNGGGGGGNAGSSGSGECVTCTCNRDATAVSVNGDVNPIWLDEDTSGDDTVIGARRLTLKVGDNVVVRATSSIVHGVALRLDNMQSAVAFDGSQTLEEAQSAVLAEIKQKLTINNEQDLENNFAAATDDLLAFQGGVPITFAQKGLANPAAFPDGVVIADFTIKPEAAGSSGSVVCTVHGSTMSFRFDVCQQ